MASMYSFLPDELLSEILAPALRVPDDSFACTDDKSPFFNYERSTSTYLLVCKDWLRVATPLLYNVVVLRSKAQTQALEFALESTPELAGFIKKLRIESGYCPSLLKILKSANNLTDFCLSFAVYSSDNVTGLCKGLSFIEPRRVIVCGFDKYDHGQTRRPLNQKAQQLNVALQQSLEKWEKLTTFVLPDSIWESKLNFSDYVDALEKNKSIEIVSLSQMYRITSWFERLSKISTLKKIVVRGTPNQYFDLFSDAIKKSARLKKLCHYTNDASEPNQEERKKTTQTARSPSPKNVFPVRNWITAFSKDIWINIFTHALEIPAMEQPDFFRHYDRHCELDDVYKYRRGLMTLCKSLHDLMVPLCYRCIIVNSVKAERLARLLDINKDVGKHIRSLFTVDLNFNTTTSLNLYVILDNVPNLERVAVTRITERGWHYHNALEDILDWTSLSKISDKAGPRLLDLSIHLHRPTTTKPPDLLYTFSGLKHLEFSSAAKFVVEPKKIKKKALPHLESIKFSSINNTLLSVLSHMDLPKIRKAQFPVIEKSEGAIAFLRKHGHKIKFLELGFLPGVNVFDVCPNLLTFEIPKEKPGFGVAEFFSSTNEHPLKVLHIKTTDVARGAVKDKFKYIADLDLSNFTSLEKLQVDACTWPTTENEIKKSLWVAWAERLHEEYEVDTFDLGGQRWVPRLRAK